MAKDALERLFEDAMNSSNPSSQYSLDEQLDVDDDFLGVMSNSSKDMLLSRIQKVDLDEEPMKDQFEDDIKSALDYNLSNEPIEENKTEEDLFGKVELNESAEEETEDENNEIEEEEEEKEEPAETPKRGRGRPRKKPLEDSESTKSSSQTPQKPSSNISTENLNSLNDFMDSLAKDLINELRESNYKTRNFNKKQMNVILDYLENKI